MMGVGDGASLTITCVEAYLATGIAVTTDHGDVVCKLCAGAGRLPHRVAAASYRHRPGRAAVADVRHKGRAIDLQVELATVCARDGHLRDRKESLRGEA